LSLKIADKESAAKEMLSSDGAPVKLMVDAAKLKFPLTLRCVEAGDKFRPFGMDGVKKVNDYLSDIKMDTVIKGVVPVLCNGIKNSPDTIICMPGLQISNSYKVSDKTERCLVISIS
jgi:tRNA(Ile)-lysidine synthase